MLKVFNVICFCVLFAIVSFLLSNRDIHKSSYTIHLVNQNDNYPPPPPPPYSTFTLTNNNDHNNNNNSYIRDWGCHRTETPFIFVHIGKAGGGTVRARFAASAENYNRNRQSWSNDDGKDGHYYPINLKHNNMPKKSSTNNAHFCMSRSLFYNTATSKFKPITLQEKGGSIPTMKTVPCNATTPIGMAIACPGPIAIEETATSKFKPIPLQKKGGSIPKIKTVPCNATTPIGMAIACPGPIAVEERCNGCSDVNSEYCRSVYVGHHVLGNEIHWLPSKYLQNWWRDSFRSNNLSSTSSTQKNTIDQYFTTITSGEESWCPVHNLSRPEKSTQLLLKTYETQNNTYYQCELSLASTIDASFRSYWKQQQPLSSITVSDREGETRSIVPGLNFGPIYASLPLHRVTVLREPFSWLVSKFFWHRIQKHNEGIPCDAKVKENDDWITEYAISYLLYLCGEDCLNRYELGILTLEGMERQASYNLRNSFSVVGLLQDLDTFYDMVAKRVQYMSTSNNLNVTGSKHGSARNKKEESERCANKFQEPDFQKYLLNKIPILNSLQRVYYLGIEVNQHQQKELQQCIISN